MNDHLGFKLVRHGVILLFLGFLTGIAVMHVKNPHMGLSAHLEGVMAGMMLLLIGGVVWERLSLPSGMMVVVYGLILYASYTTWAYTLLGAALGTSRMTPLAGAGFSAPAWQETLVSVL
ncbi:MAG: hydrogenase, partial [Pseudomonadota bacterium]